MKKRYLFILSFILVSGTILLLKSSNEPPTKNTPSVKTAKQHIIQYAKGATTKEPKPEEYKVLGINHVTLKNIKRVNDSIKYLEKTHSRSDVFNYKTYRDYEYDFNASNAIFTRVEIKNNTISNLTITPDQKSKTSLLKLKVSTTPLGKYFRPKIILKSTKKTISHTFEPGSRGIRYLNITNLIGKNTTPIKVIGKHVIIPDQNATLVQFNNPIFTNKTIFVLASHPDDAEIAAFDFYKKHHNSTYIITITAGNAGSYDKYDTLYSSGAKMYLAKGKQRVLDSITTPLAGGIKPERSINLGYFDGTLSKMFDNKTKKIRAFMHETDNINTYRKYNISTLLSDLNSTSNWNSLVNDLSYLLKKLHPDIIVTPYPQLDRHSDHKFTTVALIEALKNSHIHTGKLLLYSNHYVASEYYPFGKRGDPVTLPPNYSNPIYFNAIYSSTLTKDEQAEKYLALTRMSDLRFYGKANIWLDYCRDKPQIICNDSSYFRRSVRANELFFVVDIKNIYNNKILQIINGF